ncbi:MAG: AmmeMemoRadiSam system radical SAM enzyme [Candidatus Omnitrophica bacterium]|nr:AmmeMemoRadiSam system radical SAM enzyme [Candidatus Omnitrophota bacterium]
MKEAGFYEKLMDKKVRCFLCNHRCLIPEGKRGICGVRENRNGVLYSLVYGRLISQHIDPIEKKPFFHFFPGSTAYSIATVGCNFKCDFCQNYEISQIVRDHQQILGEETPPKEIIARALRYNCQSISYTYTEPTIAYEYYKEIMRLAKENGLYNNFVTNGYMTEEMLKDASGYLDAANVDLKSFNNEFYKKICGARLEPILEALKIMKKMNIWLEVTTLLIPGLNDSEEEMRKCAEFVLSLSKDTPWHISRFYPHYRMRHISPTPLTLLEKARNIGLALGLRYVYTGNVPGDEGENTYCYNCREVVIRRYGFEILEYNINNSCCKFCKTSIVGVGL